ncbi:protein kinase, partial [Candidatus Bathyarchaeota archaeon]
CLSFSPDGRYVVSGSVDNTLRLWDIEKGNCTRVFKGHTDLVFCLSFSPDGRYVVSGSKDKTLSLWELDWEYEFPEPKDWDERARPYLKIFLHLHPNWTEEDFKKLLSELGLRGFGWLKPEGIKRELEKMSKKRQMKSKNLQQDF